MSGNHPMGLSMDLAYPSLDNITCDPVAARIISPAYSACGSELTAIMQYLYHHFRFDGDGMDEYAALLEQISISEMHHFDILGSMLLKLGVDPVFTAMPPAKCGFFTTQYVAFSTTPSKMLMDDIAGETAAIECYRSMLCKLTNQDVSAVIQRIILDEELHLKTLNEMLEHLNHRNA